MRLLALLLLLPLYAFGATSTTIECGDTNPCDPSGGTSEDNLPSEPLLPADYCVEPPADGGSDSATGHWPLCWATPQKVTTLSGNFRLFIRDGATRTYQGKVDLSTLDGVSDSNRARFGTFFVHTDGLPYIGLSDPGNLTNNLIPKSFGSIPWIEGSYLPTCRPGCSWSNDGSAQTPAAVPSNRNSGLVAADGSTFLTVENIGIRYAAGACFRVDAPGGASSPTDNYITVHHIAVVGCADSGISILDSKHFHVYDNYADLTALEWADNKFDLWPACIGSSRTLAAYGLIEGNFCSNGYGEGVFSYTGTHVALRGNTSANMRRTPLYIAGTANDVVEQNLNIGSSVVDTHCNLASNPRCPGGSQHGGVIDALNVSQEGDIVGNAPQGTIKNIVRNNLLVSPIAEGIVAMGDAQNDLNADGTPNCSARLKVGAKWLGNTGVGTGTAIAINAGLTASQCRVDAIEMVDNLFSGASLTCSIPTNPTQISLNYNQWPSQPTDADCRGANDVNSLTTGLPGTFNFALASATNIPPISAFQPTAGAGANAGSDRSTVVALSDAGWTWVVQQFLWLPSCGIDQPTETLWRRERAYNYCNQPLDSSPNIGAF